MKAIQDVAWDMDLLNWIPYSLPLAHLMSGSCDIVGNEFCAFIGSIFMDKTDNFHDVAFYLSLVPCGSSAFSYEHYG